MSEFARNTPSEVANWLRARLAVLPNHPILRALATDDRMADLWADLGKLGEWRPGALTVVSLAVHFSTPTILSNLQKPPEERWPLSCPEYPLGVAAENLADMLQWWANAAAELWGEPVDALVERLRAFATAAFERAKAKQSVYDYIPEPSQRGRGNRKQLAFRIALARALLCLSEDASFSGRPPSREQQDRMVATITSVVFPEHAVDAETIRRHRQRQRGRRGE
jgi:hypothetical protein